MARAKKATAAVAKRRKPPLPLEQARRGGATRPYQRRTPKAPAVRTPPVVMDMPWLRKAADDVTVSYVCPMCRTRREVTPPEAQHLTSIKHVPLDTLACSPACREQWWHALMAAIQRTGQQYVLRDELWVWELEQGVVAEKLADVLQNATRGGREHVSPERGQRWPRRN